MSPPPRDTGGPAFPSVSNIAGNETHLYGATLRDLVAIHAPPVPENFYRIMWPNYEGEDNLNGGEPTPKHHARWAFAYADAWLAERNKP